MLISRSTAIGVTFHGGSFMKKPADCHLWKKKMLNSDDLNFEAVCTYVDKSHFSRSLVRCVVCGQLYFVEFNEIPDLVEGDDTMYNTYIPVKTEAEAEELAAKSPMELLQVFPRLQWDSPTRPGHQEIEWIGRED
jgi:hypothetical protein